MNKHSLDHKKQKQSFIQLQQKIIHYRSELSKYENLNDQLKKKIIMYETDDVQEDSDDKVNIEKIESIKSASAYFNYSVFLPDMQETEPETLVVGHFNMVNTGNQVLTNPFIGFRVTPVNGASISGKIALRESRENVLQTSEEEWQYMHSNWKEKTRSQGEYWLKPIHCSELKPGDALSFSNFDIRLRSIESHVKVEGFCFSLELSEGIPAMNNVSFYL